MKKLITSIALVTSVAFFGQTIEGTELKVRLATNNVDKNVARIIPIGYSGITGAQNWAIRGAYQYSTGINQNSSGGDLDLIKSLDRNTILATRKDGVALGNVGIGTTSPSMKLELGNLGAYDGMKFGSIFQIRRSTATTNHLVMENITSNGNVYLRSRTSPNRSGNLILNDAGGNVRIGSVNPNDDSELAVAGTIHCEEVQVDLDVAPDYVFEKYYTGTSTLKEGYTMPTLEEVEAYTKANNHLPSIPSAKEIKEEGLHLKEMTSLLLQKIEELTLYTIEQEKRIKVLEGKLATDK